MKNIILIILCLSSIQVFAAPLKNVTGKVTKLQLMGQNYSAYSTSGKAIAFIHMDALPASCGNASDFKRVAITSDHPAFNVVVSAALAAKASGADVQLFYLEECTLWNSNAWDFGIINIL